MSKGPLDLEPDARKVRGTAFCNDREARVSRCKGAQLRNGKRDALVSRASFRLGILAAEKRISQWCILSCNVAYQIVVCEAIEIVK